MNLGRGWPLRNLGVGKRLLIPKSAIPPKTTSMRAHIRRVQGSPTRSNKPLTMNGNTKPSDEEILYDNLSFVCTITYLQYLTLRKWCLLLNPYVVRTIRRQEPSQANTRFHLQYRSIRLGVRSATKPTRFQVSERYSLGRRMLTWLTKLERKRDRLTSPNPIHITSFI